MFDMEENETSSYFGSIAIFILQRKYLNAMFPVAVARVDLLLLCIVEIQKILHERTKDADLVRTRGVDLVYYGMAEVGFLCRALV